MNRNDCYFRSRVCYMSLPVRMKSIVIAVCTKLYRLTLHAICELCRERERETCLWWMYDLVAFNRFSVCKYTNSRMSWKKRTIWFLECSLVASQIWWRKTIKQNLKRFAWLIDDCWVYWWGPSCRLPQAFDLFILFYFVHSHRTATCFISIAFTISFDRQ